MYTVKDLSAYCSLGLYCWLLLSWKSVCFPYCQLGQSRLQHCQHLSSTVCSRLSIYLPAGWLVVSMSSREGKMDPNTAEVTSFLISPLKNFFSESDFHPIARRVLKILKSLQSHAFCHQDWPQCCTRLSYVLPAQAQSYNIFLVLQLTCDV